MIETRLANYSRQLVAYTPDALYPSDATALRRRTVAFYDHAATLSVSNSLSEAVINLEDSDTAVTVMDVVYRRLDAGSADVAPICITVLPQPVPVDPSEPSTRPIAQVGQQLLRSKDAVIQGLANALRLTASSQWRQMMPAAYGGKETAQLYADGISGSALTNNILQQTRHADKTTISYPEIHGRATAANGSRFALHLVRSTNYVRPINSLGELVEEQTVIAVETAAERTEVRMNPDGLVLEQRCLRREEPYYPELAGREYGPAEKPLVAPLLDNAGETISDGAARILALLKDCRIELLTTDDLKFLDD